MVTPLLKKELDPKKLYHPKNSQHQEKNWSTPERHHTEVTHVISQLSYFATYLCM